MSIANDISEHGLFRLLSFLLFLTFVLSLPPANAQNGDTTFTARLSGSSQVSPVATTGSGSITATLDGDSLFVSGSFNNLSSDYESVAFDTDGDGTINPTTEMGTPIHIGLPGSNGEVSLLLQANVEDNGRNGTFPASDNRFELTAGQKTALLDRKLYVNVRSQDHSTGELRGQLLMDADAHYEAIISGGSKNPSVNTGAFGGLVAERHGDSLFVSGSFSGLESDYEAGLAEGSGAHLHVGIAGRSGSISEPLTVTMGQGTRSGSFTVGDNRFELSADQQTYLSDRELYVNIHSSDHLGGEIRGQLVPVADAYLEAILTGTAKTPSVPTGASGGVIAELRGDSLFVSGSFANLESDYAEGLAQGSGAHLHLGLAGTGGGIQKALGVTVGDDDRSGTFAVADNMLELNSDQKISLQNRELYVNIHSDDNPGGELRGQMLPIANQYLQTTLSGLNEVDPDTSSGSGAVVGELSGNQLTVSGSFSGMTSDQATNIRGGAHIHLGGPGENGGIAYELTTSTDGDLTTGEFTGSANRFTLSTDTTDTLRSGMMYVNIHSQNFTGGELRGQLLLSPNSAPDSTEITSPADEATVDVSGNASTELDISWNASSDANGNEVVYIYQLSTGESFHSDSLLVNDNVGTDASAVYTYGTMDNLLENAGVETGSSIQLYHRVIASDGSAHMAGGITSATFTRGTVTSTDDAQDLPRTFILKGNYPNPFNPATTVRFDLPRQADVTIDVFDVMGRKVMTLSERQIAAGANRSIQVDAATLPSGMYLYRVRADMPARTQVKTDKMMLIK